MTDRWVKAGRESDFAGGLRMVRVADRKLVIGRLGERLYAFDALCPHAGGPMQLCEAEGNIVSCPLHAWRFDLGKDGAETHGYRGLACKSVKTEGGDVYVAMPA